MPIDLEKSVDTQNADEHSWYVCGYASTPDMDFQGDIVNPDGIDISYFVNHGWINYEHKQDAEFKLGVPTDNCYIDAQKGLYVEAKLFKDNKYAQQMWQLANDIKKNNVDRNLGFSIEGKIVSRNASQKNIIESVFVRNVALTANPANPHATWETLVKSWETGHDINPDTVTNGGAIRRESLADAITTISDVFNLKDTKEATTLWNEVAKLFDMSDRSDKTKGVIMLQLAKGLSKEDALKFVEQKDNKEE